MIPANRLLHPSPGDFSASGTYSPLLTRASPNHPSLSSLMIHPRLPPSRSTRFCPLFSATPILSSFHPDPSFPRFLPLLSTAPPHRTAGNRTALSSSAGREPDLESSPLLPQPWAYPNFRAIVSPQQQAGFVGNLVHQLVAAAPWLFSESNPMHDPPHPRARTPRPPACSRRSACSPLQNSIHSVCSTPPACGSPAIPHT